MEYVWHNTPRKITDPAEIMAFHVMTQHGNHNNETLIDAALRRALDKLNALQSSLLKGDK